MANAIIVIILIAICIYSIKSYSGKLAHGCCGGESDSPKKIKVKDKNSDHYPYSATIKIDGMTCSHCKMRVENALNENEGVWADVNLKEGLADVKMKKQYSADELKRIVTKAGYTVENVKEN